MVLMEFLGVVLPWCCNTGVVLELSGIGTAVELNVDSSGVRSVLVSSGVGSGVTAVVLQGVGIGLTAVLVQQWCW